MSYHHHHHHEHECCCSECCSRCHAEVCEHHHHHPHEHHTDFAQQLIEMADQAWMELLKEKIKEQIKTSNGSQLDQLAKLVSDANHARWKNKISLQKGVGSFKDKLDAFFHKE